MAIDISGILTEVNDLCSADKANINNAIFKRYQDDENFGSHHEVFTEIRNGSLVPIIDAAPDYGFLKVTQGGCDTNVCDVTTTSSAKKWNPIDYDCRLTICKQDLDCDFRKFWDMNCKDYSNMEDAFIDFLVAQVAKNQNASQWRIAYFDDSDDEDPLYAGIDGLFVQWMDIISAGGAYRYTIPENAEATIALQMALDPDRGYTVLKSLYDWAAVNNTSLLSTPGIHFDLTPELAYNYLSWLQDNKEVQCCFSSTDGVTASRYSMDNLNYLGIPIRIRTEWQGVIKWQQVSAGATNYDNPHRAVLTYTGNKPVGTCDADAFRNFDMWYERKDKTILIDVGTSFDAKVVLNDDFAIAY